MRNNSNKTNHTIHGIGNISYKRIDIVKMQGGVNKDTEKIQIELQWLEHLWDRGNMFERGVIRANEWYS